MLAHDTGPNCSPTFAWLRGIVGPAGPISTPDSAQSLPKLAQILPNLGELWRSLSIHVSRSGVSV